MFEETISGEVSSLRDKNCLKNNSSQTNVHEFDKVMVATGPFRSTIIPDIPGMKEFKGEIMHIKDYRQQSIFQGKRVLLVGKDVLQKLYCDFFSKKNV